RQPTELGQNARAVSRMLDSFRDQGRLSEGVALPNGGRLRIIFSHAKAKLRNGQATIPGNNSVDSPTVPLALGIHHNAPKIPAILVTKDINLRIKADALGLPAQDYESDRINISELYTGIFELAVSAEKMATFRAKGQLELNGNGNYFPNEY